MSFRAERRLFSTLAGLCAKAANGNINTTMAKQFGILVIFKQSASESRPFSGDAIRLIGHNGPVKIGSSIAEELPRIANLADLVQIEVSNYKLVFVARAFG